MRAENRIPALTSRVACAHRNRRIELPFADGHPPKRMGMEDTQRVYPKDPDPLPWPENHFDRGNW
jgi:hypothetical protein